MLRLVSITAILTFSLPALAQEKAPPPAGAHDMSKMGPMSRPVTKEDKKGVDALFKASEEAWKKGDINAVADLHDFPIIMLSDDSTGAVRHFTVTREQWMEIMKPMMANMPKDVKAKHKHTAHFLSDTLAVAIEDTNMTIGKTKGKWKSLSVLTLKDGQWKFKEVAQAGWGDMPAPGPAKSATGPSKTPTTTTGAPPK